MESVPVDDSGWFAGTGSHDVLLDASLDGDEEGALRLELRLMGEAEAVSRRAFGPATL